MSLGIGTGVCPRCNSARLHQFETKGGSPAASVPKARLPLCCVDCGAVVIDGAVVPLPDQVEQAAKTMLEKSAAAVGEAKEQVVTNEGRLDSYLKNLYRTAYLDGFFRALAFARGQQKVGRLKRLRELWRRRSARDAEEPDRHNGLVVIGMPRDLYTEFGELLELGAPGEADATDSENAGTSPQQS